MTQATPSNYWISPSAVFVQLNAVGNRNYINANCSSGCVIMCYIKDIPGLEFDEGHNFRRWPLEAYPTAFNDDLPRYIYVQIPMSESVSSKARIVFPSKIIDLYGNDAEGNQIGPNDYYYINLQGVISGPVSGKREFSNPINFGKLASDEAISVGGDYTWWEYDPISEKVTFLKNIFKGVFDWIEAANLKLNGNTLTGIASSQDSNAHDKVLTPHVASEMFLSRLADDVASGRISFQQGLTALAGSRFEKGAEFGRFVSSLTYGSGAAIDGDGNAEVESIRVRGYLEVMELIYNRLNALEGNTSFADSGTIDATEETEGDDVILHLRKRWEGDFTAFQPGDIIYSYVNDLSNGERSSSHKAWGWIRRVDRNANTLRVAMYPDPEVPGGHNGFFTSDMVISKWGNCIEPNLATYANPDYKNTVVVKREGGYANIRQSSFYISCEDGNIVELVGVNKPKLDPENYGTILGRLPEGLLDEETRKLVNRDQPYLFARGIIVQDIIRMDYRGIITRTANYRGMWSRATACSETDFYRSTRYAYDTVTHGGCLWQCIADGNTDEPSDATGSWVKMAGSDENRGLNVWQIFPNTDIVTIRYENEGDSHKTVITPPMVSCEVLLTDMSGVKLLKRNYELYGYGVKLWYSLDGELWREFIIGADEPLEFEDGSDIIEAEDSTSENPEALTLGGDDVSAEEISDRIFFELREMADEGSPATLLAKAVIPVVKDGVSYVGTVEMYAWGDSETDCPPTDGGVWSTEVPARPADRRYRFLWNYEIVMYSNGERKVTDPHCTAIDGKEIVGFEEKYLATASDTPPSADSPDWADDATLTNAAPYLWNRETVRYSDGTESKPIVRLIAQKGEDGKSYEYIYRRTSEYAAPDVPTAVSQEDDFVPEGWEDDPPQVDETDKYCWMVYRKKVDGEWSGFIGSADQPGKAFLWSAYGEQGQGVFHASVYRRCNDDLADFPPVGGDYENPVPEGWSDSIPDGDERVWISTRTFTSDGKPPQAESWSAPRPLTDTADFDVEYSAEENPSMPGPPNPGGENSNPQWSDDSTDAVWMATNVRRNGRWQGWRLSKIKGDKGDDGERGATLRGPQFWEDLPVGYQFYSGAPGEDYKDIVIYGSVDGQPSYWSCTKSHRKGEEWTTEDSHGDKLWQLGESVELVATKVLLSRLARIENLIAGNLETTPVNGAYIRAYGGLMEIFGSLGAKNIEFGVDASGYAVLKYFDHDGMELYNLGPDGIVKLVEASQSRWVKRWLAEIVDSDHDDDITGEATEALRAGIGHPGSSCFRYVSAEVSGGGKVFAECDGRTYSTTSVDGSGKPLDENRISGWYFDAPADEGGKYYGNGGLQMSNAVNGGSDTTIMSATLYHFTDGLVDRIRLISYTKND